MDQDNIVNRLRKRKRKDAFTLENEPQAKRLKKTMMTVVRGGSKLGSMDGVCTECTQFGNLISCLNCHRSFHLECIGKLCFPNGMMNNSSTDEKSNVSSIADIDDSNENQSPNPSKSGNIDDNNNGNNNNDNNNDNNNNNNKNNSKNDDHNMIDLKNVNANNGENYSLLSNKHIGFNDNCSDISHSTVGSLNYQFRMMDTCNTFNPTKLPLKFDIPSDFKKWAQSHGQSDNNRNNMMLSNINENDDKNDFYENREPIELDALPAQLCLNNERNENENQELQSWFDSTREILDKELEKPFSSKNEKKILAYFTCHDCQNDTHCCFVCKEANSESNKVVKCCQRLCGKYYHESCLANNEIYREYYKPLQRKGRFYCPRHCCWECKRMNRKNKGGTVGKCWYCPRVVHIDEQCSYDDNDKPNQMLLLASQGHHTEYHCQKYDKFRRYLVACRRHGDPPNGQFGRNDEYYGTITFEMTVEKSDWIKCKEKNEKNGENDDSSDDDENEDAFVHTSDEDIDNSDNENDNENENENENENDKDMDKEKSKSNDSDAIDNENSNENSNDKSNEIENDNNDNNDNNNNNGIEYLTHKIKVYSGCHIVSDKDGKRFFPETFKLPQSFDKDYNKRQAKLNKNPWPKGFRKIKKSERKLPGKNRKYFSKGVDLRDFDKCLCTEDDPCKIGSCTNYQVQYECIDSICGAPSVCQNRQFANQKKCHVNIVETSDRGFGAFAGKDFVAGELVLEYVGEFLTKEESQERLKQMNKEGAPNFYFFSINAGTVIDASVCGNEARFLNHSCDPNCRTELWEVNGERRLGIIANVAIAKGSELTYDYKYEVENSGNVPLAKCRCGATKCRRFLGFTRKQALAFDEKEKTSETGKDKGKEKSKESDKSKNKDNRKDKRGRKRKDSEKSESKLSKKSSHKSSHSGKRRKNSKNDDKHGSKHRRHRRHRKHRKHSGRHRHRHRHGHRHGGGHSSSNSSNSSNNSNNSNNSNSMKDRDDDSSDRSSHDNSENNDEDSKNHGNNWNELNLAQTSQLRENTFSNEKNENLNENENGKDGKESSDDDSSGGDSSSSSSSSKSEDESDDDNSNSDKEIDDSDMNNNDIKNNDNNSKNEEIEMIDNSNASNESKTQDSSNAIDNSKNDKSDSENEGIFDNIDGIANMWEKNGNENGNEKENKSNNSMNDDNKMTEIENGNKMNQIDNVCGNDDSKQKELY